MGTGWERRRQEDEEWASPGDWRQAWKHGPHAAVYVLVLLAILIGGGFVIRSYLLPAEESLRREVYEESKSYLDGTVRDLDNLHLQWLASDDSMHRKALAATARHRAADFPDDRLPERLVDWLAEIH